MTEPRKPVPSPGQMAKRVSGPRPTPPPGRRPGAPAAGDQAGQRRGGPPETGRPSAAGPDPTRDFRAVAPYGLVPLPDRPMPATTLQRSVVDTNLTQADLLRSHDRRVPGTHTGWIDVQIRTLTPLFVGATQEEDRDKPSRSLLVDGSPAIPGSSLRGLVRNQIRMLTGGETGPVNTPQLFFRAPASSHDNPRVRTVMRRLSKQYEERHGTPPKPPGNPVSAGFLRKEGEGWWVYPLATKRPLQMRLTELQEDFTERFEGHDLPPFQLPPDPSVEKKEKWDNYIPADYHRDFQYLKVVALCPELPPNSGAAGEYDCWAMSVIPAGESMTGDDEEMVRYRLQEHWDEKLQKAAEKYDASGNEYARRRRNDFKRARRDLDRIRIRQVPCVLVLTGIAGERKNAYLFPLLKPARPRLPVPKELVAMVESTDQLTQFQEQNFPNEPEIAVGRPRDPKRPEVRDGKYGSLARNAPEPVWYQERDGQVVSFGRSGGYRVAVGDWDTSPIERAVPSAVLSPQRPGDGDRARGRAVDVPRAIFGDIDLFDEKVPAARGRVSFGPAVSTDAPYEFPHPLRVELLKPGRTCFANYVVQPADNRWSNRPDLLTWSHEGDVRLGGYKVYLHRHDEETDRYAELHPDRVDPGETKRLVHSLRAGLTFRGRITFTNLTSAELGALLRALLLDNPVDGGDPSDPTHAHKLGLGKSLGMGSVHIRPRLYLVDATERVASLDLHAGYRPANDAEVGEHLSAFDTALLEWERETIRSPSGPPQGWRDIERVRALLLAAQWRDRLPWDATRTMELEEYEVYPVLPTIAERFDARNRGSRRR